MKKLLTVVVALTLGVVFAACAPKATKDECNSTCQKLASLQESGNPKAAAQDPMLADLMKKIKDIHTQKEQAVAAIDKEMNDKIAAASKPEPKKGKKAKAKGKEDEAAKLTKEFGEKKAAKAKEFDAQIQALEGQRGDIEKKAAEAKAKADAEAKAAAEQAVAVCTDDCVKAGTKKAKVECQLKAATLDEYNACK
jgi:hypothetical protein